MRFVVRLAVAGVLERGARLVVLEVGQEVHVDLLVDVLAGLPDFVAGLVLDFDVERHDGLVEQALGHLERVDLHVQLGLRGWLVELLLAGMHLGMEHRRALLEHLLLHVTACPHRDLLRLVQLRTNLRCSLVLHIDEIVFNAVLEEPFLLLGDQMAPEPDLVFVDRVRI